MNGNAGVEEWQRVLLRRGVESTLNHILRTYRLVNSNEVRMLLHPSNLQPLHVQQYIYQMTKNGVPVILNQFSGHMHEYQQKQPEKPWEKDHFFEVQHVVTLMGGEALRGEALPKITLLELLTLALYVNDARNLFQINKTANRQKAYVVLDAFVSGSTLAGANDIDAYLHSHFTDSGATVCQVLWDLATDMNALVPEGQFQMSQVVGNWMCTILETHFEKRGVTSDQLQFMKDYKKEVRGNLAMEKSLDWLQMKILEEDDGKIDEEH